MHSFYENDDALIALEFDATKKNNKSRIEARLFSKDTKYVNRGQRTVYRDSQRSNVSSKSTRYNVELSDYAHALCVSNKYSKEIMRRREASKQNYVDRNRSRGYKYSINYQYYQ